MRTLAELVPLRSAACRAAADAVSLIAAGEAGVDPAGGAHVRSCLRCQAEVAAFRRVLRTLHDMRGDVLAHPAGAVAATIGALDGVPDPATSWGVRAAACVGGLTAASAAGVLVWIGRRRLGLLPAS